MNLVCRSRCGHICAHSAMKCSHAMHMECTTCCFQGLEQTCIAVKVNEDVPLGVHAERQVGIALISALVIVRILITVFCVLYVESTACLVVFFDPEIVYLNTKIMILGDPETEL